MKRALPTHARVRELFSYNARTGEFVRLVRQGPELALTTAGHLNAKTRRVAIHVDGRLIGAHRLAWFYVTAEWPKNEIDHRDTNPSNNRWANLRDVTSTVNHQNMRAAPPGKKYSPLLGAHWCAQGGFWKSSIRVHGKTVHLGTFDTDAEAHAAYVAAKRRLHEGCTL